jgi:hypothetical protein
MERVQDGDGFGPFVTDRVAQPRNGSRSRFDASGELGPVPEPGPAAGRALSRGRGTRIRVTMPDLGDPESDHTCSSNAERTHPCQPAGRCDPAGGLCLDGLPDGVPGDPELVRQSQY